MKEKSTIKINWISILQGWSMLLVVIGHAGLSKIPRNPDEPVISLIEYLIYSFHMPLFMMISGHLFYLTRVRSSVSYRRMVSGKFKRLGIPYVAFTGITFLLKNMFNEHMVRQTSFSAQEIMNAFLYPTHNPLGELWFIATLLVIFIFSPLLTGALRKPLYAAAAGLALFLLYLFPGNIQLFCLSLAARYGIWFFIGLLIGKYQGKDYLDSRRSLAGAGLLFSLAFILSHRYGIREIDFVVTLAGCFFSYALALRLDRRLPALFHTFRDYTFQIYLLGIFFQIAFKLFYQKLLSPHGYGLAFCACVLLGIYMPVLIAGAVQKMQVRALDLILGLTLKKQRPAQGAKA